MRLSIIAIVGMLFLSACAPAQIAAPTSTATSTPPPPVFTPTLQPQPTDTAIPPAPLPETDILTRAQKERLYQASLAYLAPTQEQAFAVVEKLNYVQYAHPSNMCGPLAIAEKLVRQPDFPLFLCVLTRTGAKKLRKKKSALTNSLNYTYKMTSAN